QRELVGEIRERARVQEGVVAQIATGAHPGELVRLWITAARHAAAIEQQGRRLGGEAFGVRGLRGRADGLDLGAALGRVEAGDEVQDRAARLVRHDLAGRERSAV